MRRRHTRSRARSLVLALAAVAAAGLSGAAAAQAPAGDEPAPELIILVRHAETQPDGTRDPALSPAGLGRADRLATLLGEAGLTAVHSSPYRRTRGTAQAVAGALDLPVAEYDPRDLPGFAAHLRLQPGRHLVVGHSNTTPELVALLGGDAGPPIAEHEHGRIYVLATGREGVRTVVLRY